MLLAQVGIREVDVDLRRGDRGVAHEAAHHAGALARPHELGGGGMPEAVGMDVDADGIPHTRSISMRIP